MSTKSDGMSGTTCIEAMSDGIFAIIITLLVLEIPRPVAAEGDAATTVGELPSYLTYGSAFVYVGVIWLNHHWVFVRLRKMKWIDLGVPGTNGLILFPMGVLADSFNGNLEDQKAPIAHYAPIGGIMSLAWVPLYSYLGKKADLLDPEIATGLFKAQVRKPLKGIFLYFVSGLLGWFVHPVIAFLIFMASYYAWTSQGVRFVHGKIK